MTIELSFSNEIQLKFAQKQLITVGCTEKTVRFSHVARLLKIPPIGFFLLEIQGLNHAEGRPWLRLVESYLNGHGGLDVCLGDGKTEAGGIPSQGGRGDAVLRRMPPYLT